MSGHAKHHDVVSFETHPSSYKHWKLDIDGAVATLTLDIDETNGRVDGYLLKQNSYDLGVDLELHDAIERLRFEHPSVRSVIVTSGQPRVFCAGANIRMLASSTHHFKVNFCKYTNETRVGMEEASRESGITFIAALNGTAAGGGYELALSTDRIVLIDDGSSAVSLPEVPLLGVLPGTGGLTRLVDKRMVRRDLADLFCTRAEGFRARDAVKYGLVDTSFTRSKFQAGVRKIADDAAATSPARAAEGIELPPIASEKTAKGIRYEFVELELDDDSRVATLTIHAPTSAPFSGADGLRAAGASTWGFQMFREFEDALLQLRFNHPTLGLIVVHTRGSAEKVLEHDAALHSLAGDWLADEIIAYRARVLRRYDNMSRSLFAIMDEGSCFVGTLFELTLGADRSFMMEDLDGEVTAQVTEASDGRYAMQTGISRLLCRFAGAPEKVDEALDHAEAFDAPTALDMGLVTMAPDDLDWDDEIRIAIEERASLSPDALTGMEQNLRFVGAENCDTKIYGRLTAWQNWIFQRPNAVGDTGALTLYGHPEQPSFDWWRT